MFADRRFAKSFARERPIAIHEVAGGHALLAFDLDLEQLKRSVISATSYNKVTS